MSLRDVQLPSGAALRVQAAKFADAKALLSAFTAELRGFQISAGMDMTAVYKEIACIALSSPTVDRALWACMSGCLYVPQGSEIPLKLTADVFEPVERRDDVIKVYMEVARDNVGPFMKTLFALWSQAQAAASTSAQESEPKTTTS